MQHHALSGKVLHVDFHEVAATDKVTITVPVEAIGEAAGVKSGGGVLEHVLFKVKVKALPKDLPEILEVDVSKLEIGQSIHLGDIPVPAGVEIIGDKHITVLAVAAPITEAEETAAAAASATPGEVEVIKEKKDETAEGATPAAKGGDKTAEKGEERKSRRSRQSWQRIPGYEAQRWLYAGGQVGRTLARLMGAREKISSARGSRRSARSEVDSVRTADVHESERRSGCGVDEVFSDSAELYVGFGG